jgi:metallo-beta-lactamase class B
MKISTSFRCRRKFSVHYLVIPAFVIFSVLPIMRAMAQNKEQMIRLAKIKVDPLQLEKYNTALKEQMTTAIRVEPGVLTYYAVADKADPANITILEIYADTSAYQLHIRTPHFLKYKETVKDMVKSLELVDVTLVGVAKKPDISILESRQVYVSKNMIITQIAANSFKHTSFLQTNDFGNVPCNGLVVKNGNEVIVFDTPTRNESAEELISWIRDSLHSKVKAIIPTHFHNDCLGGLKAFHDHAIPSYAYFRTIELASANQFSVPQNGFRDSLRLKVGKEYIIVKFPGEGHTKDNVVGYFPADRIMFGGCLVKELNAGKGFLGDANLLAWPITIENVKNMFPEVRIVVPGHGEHGDNELLDYTIRLFKDSN